MKKSEQSKTFFNDPNNYLVSNVIIDLRRGILGDLIGDVKGKTILDIGCGNGDLTRYLTLHNKVTYLDVSPNMIELTKRNIPEDNLSNCSFFTSDFESFQTGTRFDIIVCIGVVAHVESVDELIRKVVSVAKPKAEIILQFTAAEKLIARFNRFRTKVSSKDKYSQTVNLTTTGIINEILAKHGLRVLRKVNYIPISPILSVFNAKTKLKILSRNLNSRLFSMIGSEIILHIEKQD